MVVCVELPLQTKVNVAQVFQAGVRDPHAGEYMCHVAEIALKGVFSYGRASCLQGSQSNLL